MAPFETISDLFALAIAAEEAAHNFYSGLSQIFSHVPEAGLLWKSMMRDESMHARELRDLRNMLSDTQLKVPVEQSLIIKTKSELERFAKKFDLSSVKTLDDAYEIAYDLENSEVNIVFQAIVSEFVSSADRSDFLISQLREHVAKLEDFSKTVFNSEDRRGIKAIYGKQMN